MTDHAPPGVSFRRATLDDAPAVNRLLADSGLPTDGVDQLIRSGPAFLVAEREGAVVAAGGLEPCGSDSLLRSVVVRDDLRSSGIGRELVERLIEQAECEGVRDLYLLTTSAERYFPRFGFTVVERTAAPDAVRATDEFSSACCETAVFMRRSMREGDAELPPRGMPEPDVEHRA